MLVGSSSGSDGDEQAHARRAPARFSSGDGLTRSLRTRRVRRCRLRQRNDSAADARNGDLEQFYEWVRGETPRRHIRHRPETPVKMSGNVSELPAFTARTLFTDTPNYLTTPNRDSAFRAQLASRPQLGNR